MNNGWKHLTRKVYRKYRAKWTCWTYTPWGYNQPSPECREFYTINYPGFLFLFFAMNIWTWRKEGRVEHLCRLKDTEGTVQFRRYGCSNLNNPTEVIGDNGRFWTLPGSWCYKVICISLVMIMILWFFKNIFIC